MHQVSIKYTNVFHCKTLQNLPKFGFLVRKQTIWQPCFQESKIISEVRKLKLQKNISEESAFPFLNNESVITRRMRRSFVILKNVAQLRKMLTFLQRHG
jgi:hypothetical protein